MRRRRQQRERQKGNRLLGQTTTLHVHNAFFFVHFLPSLHNYDMKKPHFTFYGGHRQVTTKFSFSFLSELGYGC